MSSGLIAFVLFVLLIILAYEAGGALLAVIVGLLLVGLVWKGPRL